MLVRADIPLSSVLFPVCGTLTGVQPAAVQWHLDRVDRYNGVYGAIETVFRREALAEAARHDGEVTESGSARGPLWGVPIGHSTASMILRSQPRTPSQLATRSSGGWLGSLNDGSKTEAKMLPKRALKLLRHVMLIFDSSFS